MTKPMVALLACLALAPAAQAQSSKLGGAPNPGFGAPVQLPERKDVVSWKTFAQVELVRQKDRFTPNFAPAVAALDKKEVKVQGFMMPLTPGERQAHFVLTAMPQDCAFCLPGGPEAMVEVRAKTPVRYTVDPVVLSGRLTLLKNDPTGIFYRLTDAEPSK